MATDDLVPTLKYFIHNVIISLSPVETENAKTYSPLFLDFAAQFSFIHKSPNKISKQY